MALALKPEDYWQEFLPARTVVPGAPFKQAYSATLPDGRRLQLPIRPLPDGKGGLCSLIVTQASFEVLDALAENLAVQLAQSEPEVIVGLPTLGLTLAAAVSRRLGHSRYVALGTSRKFWYDEALSVPLSSITTPSSRRLFLDPRQLPLLEGRRVALLDDVISSGGSIVSGLGVLGLAGCAPVSIGCAMLQGARWRDAVSPVVPDWQARVVSVLSSPRLVAVAGGWAPE